VNSFVGVGIFETRNGTFGNDIALRCWNSALELPKIFSVSRLGLSGFVRAGSVGRRGGFRRSPVGGRLARGTTPCSEREEKAWTAFHASPW
jgi:hypothetical protein